MSTLYGGQPIPGLDRVAGHFMDGNAIKVALISDRWLAVYDQFGAERYKDPTRLPEGFIPKSIGCIRSANTGLLIAVVGGFFAGSSNQTFYVLATDYPVRPPAVFQG